MSNQRWQFLERAFEDLSKNAQSTGLDSILVDRIEAAAASADKDKLTIASDELVAFLDKLVVLLPDNAQRALRDGIGDRTLLLAHAMGQVGFAQLFASRIAGRRASSEVEDALVSPRFAPFLKELYRKDRNGRDLATAVDQTPENVSRVLSDLRKLGLVGYRKHGTSVVNFLTATARAAYAEAGEQERIARNDARRPAAERLIEVLEGIPEHMQTMPDLAPKDVLLPS